VKGKKKKGLDPLYGDERGKGRGTREKGRARPHQRGREGPVPEIKGRKGGKLFPARGRLLLVGGGENRGGGSSVEKGGRGGDILKRNPDFHVGGPKVKGPRSIRGEWKKGEGGSLPGRKR